MRIRKNTSQKALRIFYQQLILKPLSNLGHVKEKGNSHNTSKLESFISQKYNKLALNNLNKDILNKMSNPGNPASEHSLYYGAHWISKITE